MNKIQAIINQVIASIDRIPGSDPTSEDSAEERLVAFNKSTIAYKAIYVLYHDKIDPNKRNKDLQDTFRLIKKHDARNMSLIQFIKMKAGL